MNQKIHGRRVALVAGALMLLAAMPAIAQVSTYGLLDVVAGSFSLATAKWAGVFQKHAEYLFFSLATISMVWTYGLLALKQADISEFMAETIKFIIFFGFFLWLLTNGTTFADNIIMSLRKMGSEAIGRSDVLTPSKIVDVGFRVFFRAVDDISVFSPIVSAAALIMSGGVLISLAFLAYGMIKLMLSAWLMIYAGVFFLGFGGSRWTSDIAIYYYKSVLGVGAELMTFILLVGVGQSLIDQFAAANGTKVNLKSLAALLIACVLLYELCKTLPARVASIATGGAIQGHGGGGIGGAAMLAGAAMGALAVTSVAKGIAGGAEAVGAALKSAKAAAAAGSGPGGVGGIAMGTAGRLASALGSVAASNLGKAAFGSPDERKKTFGGKMADQIRQKDAPRDPGSQGKPGAGGFQSDSGKSGQPAASDQGSKPAGSSDSSGNRASPSAGGNSFGAGTGNGSAAPSGASPAGPAGSPKAASPEVEAFARPSAQS